MDFVRIENLSISVGQFNLQNVNLTIPRGEVMVILGSSGSGKSVLLESIAGFYPPTHGHIWLDGREMTEAPPEKRQIGFMFQDYALFPHLTVWENITFSLRFRHQGPPFRRGTAFKSENGKSSMQPENIVNMLHIEHLLSRYPLQLSGGEKQRVAMARALIQQPKLFLLDEPMSALDARTREELRDELRSIFKTLGLTAIYVTHDQTEALALADRVCILNAGHMVQFGMKEEVFNQPHNSFVAKFVGMENIFSGVVESTRKVGNTQEHSVQVQGLGSLTILSELDSQRFEPGEIVNVGIRPEDILIEVDSHAALEVPQTMKIPAKLSNGSESRHAHEYRISNHEHRVSGAGIPLASNQYPEENRLHAIIMDIVPWGVVYKLHLGGTIVLLTALATKHQLQSLKLKRDGALQIFLPPQNLHLMHALRAVD
ncbi:MAG: ABC transporter ATP-binding protein [Desulfitobacteriaceae bacterium]